MSEANPDIEKTIEKAKADGFEVVQSDNWILLLDFDAPKGSSLRVADAPDQFYKGLEIIQQFIACREVERWISKSGRGLHVLVKLDSPLPILARLALQAALGSDPVREVLSIRLALAGAIEPSLLFRPTTAAIEREGIDWFRPGQEDAAKEKADDQRN